MEQFNYRTPQCTCDTSAVLSVKIFFMFENSVQRIVGYQTDYISDLHASVRSKYHITAPVQICYRKSQNEYFPCGLCEVSCDYEQQCAHSLSGNGGKYVMSQFNSRSLRQDVVSIFCLSKKNTEVGEEP